MENQNTKQRREAEKIFNDISVLIEDTVSHHGPQIRHKLMLNVLTQDITDIKNDKNHLAWSLLTYHLLSRLT